MILFVPVLQGEPLTRELWRLAVTNPELNATNKMFAVIEDAQTLPQHWLVVDTDFTIRVHPDADLGGIAQILQPWIDVGDLPADTNTQLAALIESKRGQQLVVYDAFPQLLKDMSKTYPQMIAAGLLAEPNTP